MIEMTVRSLLLGIDVSPKRMGWGLVDLVTGEPVACGMEPIDLPDAGWHHQQVARALREVMGHEGRRIVGREQVNSGGEIQAVFIEDTAGAGKFRQHDAGRAQGMVQAEVERRWPWVTVQFLKPAEWKKLAGLKGNASKDDIYAHVHLWIGADEKGHPRSQDACDALLIALAGQRRNRETWDAGCGRSRRATHGGQGHRDRGGNVTISDDVLHAMRRLASTGETDVSPMRVADLIFPRPSLGAVWAALNVLHESDPPAIHQSTRYLDRFCLAPAPYALAEEQMTLSTTKGGQHGR